MFGVCPRHLPRFQLSSNLWTATTFVPPDLQQFEDVDRLNNQRIDLTLCVAVHNPVELPSQQVSDPVVEHRIGLRANQEQTFQEVAVCLSKYKRWRPSNAESI
jgi:hypothetical protein